MVFFVDHRSMTHSTFSSVLAAICVASQLLQIELDPRSILDLYCRSHEERVEAAAAANTFFTIIRPILPEGVRYKLLDFFGVDGGAATQSDSATPVAPKRGLGQCGHGPNKSPRIGVAAAVASVPPSPRVESPPLEPPSDPILAIAPQEPLFKSDDD